MTNSMEMGCSHDQRLSQDRLEVSRSPLPFGGAPDGDGNVIKPVLGVRSQIRAIGPSSRDAHLLSGSIGPLIGLG